MCGDYPNAQWQVPLASHTWGQLLNYNKPTTNYPWNHVSMEKYRYSCCKFPYPGTSSGDKSLPSARPGVGGAYHAIL